MEALRALSEPRHACHGCGGCCHGVRVRLLGAEEETRVRQLARDLHVLDPIENGRLRQVDGHCVFLMPDQRCQLHRHFGAAAKPLLCQQFPAVLLDTESESRVGVDPGCFTIFSQWREGDPLPANARLAPNVSVLEPDQVAAERTLLTWLRHREDATVGGALRLVVGAPEAPEVPPELASRWLRHLQRAPIRPLLLRPETGAPVRDALLPVLDRVARLDPEKLPGHPLGPEEEAFALELLRRTLFLRLMPSLPVVQAVALLNLLGGLTVGWSGLQGRGFGRALVAWNRALRGPVFWSAILPTAESLRQLALGPSPPPCESQ